MPAVLTAAAAPAMAVSVSCPQVSPVTMLNWYEPAAGSLLGRTGNFTFSLTNTTPCPIEVTVTGLWRRVTRVLDNVVVSEGPAAADTYTIATPTIGTSVSLAPGDSVNGSGTIPSYTRYRGRVTVDGVLYYNEYSLMYTVTGTTGPGCQDTYAYGGCTYRAFLGDSQTLP